MAQKTNWTIRVDTQVLENFKQILSLSLGTPVGLGDGLSALMQYFIDCPVELQKQILNKEPGSLDDRIRQISIDELKLKLPQLVDERINEILADRDEDEDRHPALKIAPELSDEEKVLRDMAVRHHQAALRAVREEEKGTSSADDVRPDQAAG